MEVEFAASGLQVVAAAMGYRAGLERTTIVVGANDTAKLVYRGGVFWKMGAHSLERIDD